MNSRPIVLTGFMGTGKSTIGKILASRMGLSLRDIDLLVEERQGCSINELFATKGEGYFRDIESQVLQDVMRERNVVVSTGGGAVIAPENRRIMRNSAFVINLTATPEVIQRRLAAENERPLLRDNKCLEKIAALLSEREQYYADADIRIDTTAKNVEDVASEIINLLGEQALVMAPLTVELGERSYDIHFGDGILDETGSMCRNLSFGNRCALITNPTVGIHYAGRVSESLENAGFSVSVLEIPDGESYKSSHTLSGIYDFLISSGINRESFIVALGGGVVGDIAGYAAATFLRGIPFVQVPTTLLAQVDSSVGGKTGINHPLGKNLIGAFYQPRLVLVDITTLDTLPVREYRSGLAEIVKYGIVCDGDFFGFLETNLVKLSNGDRSALASAIRTSCAIKASVVGSDEREGGLRAVLNYGHTFAHAVESLTGYSRYLHGEAVSIGMVQAAMLSGKRGYATSEDTERIIALLRSLNLPVTLEPFSPADYRVAMSRDKKARDGGINFVFNRNIGGHVIEKTMDWDFLLCNVTH